MRAAPVFQVSPVQDEILWAKTLVSRLPMGGFSAQLWDQRREKGTLKTEEINFWSCTITYKQGRKLGEVL